MSKRRDEQTKLAANLLNTVAASCITVGVIAPLVAVYFDFGNQSASMPAWKPALSTLAFLFGAYVLHKVAKRILESHSE